MRVSRLQLKRFAALIMLSIIAFLIKTVAKDLSRDSGFPFTKGDPKDNLLIPSARAEDAACIGGGCSSGCGGCGGGCG